MCHLDLSNEFAQTEVRFQICPSIDRSSRMLVVKSIKIAPSTEALNSGSLVFLSWIISLILVPSNLD